MTGIIEKDFSKQSDRLDFAFEESRKKISENKSFTAKEAYAELGLSQSTFSAYRKGSEPSALVLRRLAKTCDFNIHWLVTGEGSMYTHDPITSKNSIAHISNTNETIAVSDDLIKSLPAESLRFDTVKNNDVHSVAKRGDTVLVDVSFKSPEGLMLVEFKNFRQLRHVQIKSENQFVVACDNNEPEVVSIDDLTVLGRVVWRCGEI